MGKLFTLDSATKSTIQDALDDIIAEFGKDCRLVYEGKWAACVNCLIDATSGKSTNRWRTGGPVPFQIGVCPQCKGTGRRAEEVSESVRFKVEWEPKNFEYPVEGLDLRVPHSVCQIKGYLSDLPKVNRCDHIIIQTPIEGIIQARFKLYGEPISPGNIIQGRYFVAALKQLG